jgi:hypothetical protein
VIPESTVYRVAALMSQMVGACDNTWRNPGELRERAGIGGDPASQSAARGAIEIAWAEGLVERKLDTVTDPMQNKSMRVYFRAKGVIAL